MYGLVELSICLLVPVVLIALLVWDRRRVGAERRRLAQTTFVPRLDDQVQDSSVSLRAFQAEWTRHNNTSTSGSGESAGLAGLPNDLLLAGRTAQLDEIITELRSGMLDPIIGTTRGRDRLVRHYDELRLALVSLNGTGLAAQGRPDEVAESPTTVTADQDIVAHPFVPQAASPADRPIPRQSNPPSTSSPALPPPAPERQPAPWALVDRAVALLYLGAFLIVAAGLVFATSNWDVLSDRARFGLLGGTMTGFIGAGLILLSVPRVRPAGVTFVGIGALLAPLNLVLAQTIMADQEIRTVVTYEIGIVAISALYAVFSFLPGGAFYRYGAVLSATLALALLPEVLGIDSLWGAAFVAAIGAIAVDAPRQLRGRLRRFASPVVRVATWAQPATLLAAGAAIFERQSEWIVPVTFGLSAITVWRFAVRRGSARLLTLVPPLTVVAAIAALVSASVDDVLWPLALVPLAGCSLWLTVRGPAVASRDPARLVFEFSAITLMMVSPIFDVRDSPEWWIGSVWIGAAAAVIVVARSRTLPALTGLAAVVASAAMFAIGSDLPVSVRLSLPFPMVLLAIPALLLAASIVARTIVPANARAMLRWVRPVGVIAAIEGIALTIVSADGFTTALATDDEFVLAGVAIPLAIAAIIGASVYRVPHAFVAAAIWAELALVAIVAGVPIYSTTVAPDRSVPLLALDNLIGGLLRWDPEHALPGFAALSLLLAGATALGAERLAAKWAGAARDAALVAVAGATAAFAGMALIAVPYVADLQRPAQLTAFPETAWWWPYLLVTTISALVLSAIAMRKNQVIAAVLGTSLWVGAALIGLRMLYDQGGDIQRWPLAWFWLGILLTIGPLVPRSSTRTGGILTTGISRFGIVLSVSSGIAAAAYTLAFVGDAVSPGEFGSLPDRSWWWPHLATWIAVVVVFLVAGRWLAGHGRYSSVVAFPGIFIGGSLALLLSLRMLTTDIGLWMYALTLIAAVLAIVVREITIPIGAFDRALTSATGRYALGLGLAGVGANLFVTFDGRVENDYQAIYLVLLGITALGASFRYHQPVLSALSFGSIILAIPYVCLAFGIRPSEIGIVYAAVSWVFVSGWVIRPSSARLRNSWAGIAGWSERAAYAAATLPVVFALAGPGVLEPGTAPFQRFVLALVSLAAVLGVIGFLDRRRIQGYVASALALVAVVLQIAAAEPANIQAYTIPVALYLFIVAWTARRTAPRVFDGLVAGGAVVLLAPPFTQALAPDGFVWSLVTGAEALVLVAVGVVIKRRVLFAAGVAGMSAVVLRQLGDYVNAVPTWAALATTGALLLLAGTIILIARDGDAPWAKQMRGRWTGMR